VLSYRHAERCALVEREREAEEVAEDFVRDVRGLQRPDRPLFRELVEEYHDDRRRPEETVSG
jgi:hypothetical protein